MVTTSVWDASEYLEDEQNAIAYINAAAELDDPALLQAAIGDVAKARGMGQIAKEAGVGRESLYKSLGRDGNPSFRTIAKVVKALGGRIVIEPSAACPRPSDTKPPWRLTCERRGCFLSCAVPGHWYSGDYIDDTPSESASAAMRCSSCLFSSWSRWISSLLVWMRCRRVWMVSGVG